MTRRLVLPMMMVLFVAASTAEAGVKEGDRAPELKGVTWKSGKAMTLSQFKGKVVVLTFGASWCAPCKKELPAFDKLAIDLVRNKKLPVRFVAINVDSELAAGKRFVGGLGLDCIFTGYDPRSKTAVVYGPAAMPTTFIIDKKGIVRHVHKGFRKGDEDRVASLVRKLL